MTSRQTEIRDCLNALSAGKVPHVIKTSYDNNNPVRSEVMKITVTKRDRFYRLNGKIVSRNMAAWCCRLGLAAA